MGTLRRSEKLANLFTFAPTKIAASARERCRPLRSRRYLRERKFYESAKRIDLPPRNIQQAFRNFGRLVRKLTLMQTDDVAVVISRVEGKIRVHSLAVYVSRPPAANSTQVKRLFLLNT